MDGVSELRAHYPKALIRIRKFPRSRFRSRSNEVKKIRTKIYHFNFIRKQTLLLFVFFMCYLYWIQCWAILKPGSGFLYRSVKKSYRSKAPCNNTYIFLRSENCSNFNSWVQSLHGKSIKTAPILSPKYIKFEFVHKSEDIEK